MLKTMTVRATIAAILAGLSMSAYAIAHSPRRVDIPAGELRQALLQVSEQFGTDLVYSPEQIEGIQTRGAHGELTTEQAVTKLLEGTPLELRTDPSGAMLITPPANSSPSPTGRGDKGEGSTTTPAEKKSFWSRLRLAQGETPFPSQGEARDEDRTAATGVSGPAGAEGQQTPKKEAVEEILVTGTMIRGLEPGSSPVIVFHREDIEQSGATTVDQFMRQVPQDFANVDGLSALGNANSAEASKNLGQGSSVNLRGLGAGATLVLVNGRRMAPTGTDGSLVDISAIPLSAVERVEILTDGASAIYGADAVAGVVNFILRKKFDGADTRLRYGNSTQDGGREFAAGQSFGTSWANGSVLMTYEHVDQNPIRANQRDFVTPIGGPANGASEIIPGNNRDGVFFTGRQQLGKSTELSADATYSERDFGSISTNGTTITTSTGSTKAYGGSLGVTRDLPADWQAEAVGSYSFARADLTNATLIAGVQQPLAPLASRSDYLALDLKADGPILQLPGGRARISVAGHYREEGFDDIRAANVSAGRGLDRNVRSLFTEVFVPIIGSKNAIRAVQRLELSAAVRYDDYEDIGSSANPKFGLLWSPFEGLNFRGTYAESFRAPPLAQLSSAGAAYTILRLSNPADTDLRTNTIIFNAPGNSALTPETSDSYSVGLDFRPRQLPLTVSATYFNIQYDDRISKPQLASTTLVHLQRAAFGPFLNYLPSASEVANIYSQPNVVNPTRIPAAAIESIFDNRLHNVSFSSTDGVDLTGSYRLDLGADQLMFVLSGSKLLSSDFQATPSTTEVSAFDQVFFPTDLRARASVTWRRSAFSSTLSANYASSYADTLVTPNTEVPSWTTFDLVFGYEPDLTRSSPLRGLSASILVQNLADKDPPSFAVPAGNTGFLGYDPANASARGRIISLMVGKRW